MNQQTLRIRCFARLRELVGAEYAEVAVAGECRVRELRGHLAAAYPALAEERLTLLVARNGNYAGDEEVVTAEDDLACFPPVSGG